MKTYPYLGDSKIIINDICDKCKKRTSKLIKLEWQVSWFRGDDEIEKRCLEYVNKLSHLERKQIPKNQILKLISIQCANGDKCQILGCGFHNKLITQ